MADSRQTAYASNADPSRQSKAVGSGWDPRIDVLLAQGYRFLGYRFSEPGWLFRGACSGLRDFFISGQFGHYEGDKAVVHMEKELDILLISQDFSDAYGAARLWEKQQDNFIAVFKSVHFNRELQARRAAVMGIAEPGVVFKYPFLTRPLPLSAIDWIIIAPATLESLKGRIGSDANANRKLRDAWLRWREEGHAKKLLVPSIAAEEIHQRSALERALLTLLEERGVKPAKPEVTLQRPRLPV